MEQGHRMGELVREECRFLVWLSITPMCLPLYMDLFTTLELRISKLPLVPRTPL